jgi:hypothetical protein
VDQLCREFEPQLRDAIAKSIALRYHPRLFEEMLDTSDGRTVAKHFVRSRTLHYGLRRLAKLNRLDLSLESIMLDPKFESLFDQNDLDAARWRLSAVRQS